MSFLSTALHIGRMEAHFLKGLEIPYQFFFSARLGNIKSAEKNKEQYGNIEMFFFRSRVCLSAWYKRIFLKDLKFPINSYFFSPIG